MASFHPVICGYAFRMTHRRFVNRRIRVCFALVTMLFSFGVYAGSLQTLTLAWDPGSDPSIAGYNLYYGPQNAASLTKIDVGTNTAATVTNLGEGQTYQFSVTSYDALGNESTPSMTISYLTPGLLLIQRGSAADPISLYFPVAPSHWYDLRATSDFKTWTSIWQTDVETDYTWEIYDDADLTAPARFYRLVLH
jgi:hypothetical protein